MTHRPPPIMIFCRLILAAFVAMLPLSVSAKIISPQISIKLSHIYGVETPTGKASEFFAKRAAELTNGRVSVTVYGNGMLYKDQEELEALQLGAVQMLAPSLSKLKPNVIAGSEVFNFSSLDYAIIANKRFWAALPDDVRGQLERAMQEAAVYKKATMTGQEPAPVAVAARPSPTVTLMGAVLGTTTPNAAVTTPANPVVAAQPVISPVRDDGETALWAEVQKGNSKDDYEAYLSQYPQGIYASLAKSRIRKLGEVAATGTGRSERMNSAPGAHEKRIALVIGNSAYKDSPLKNPVNDAKDISAKLRKLSFDVIERNNLQTKQIGSTLRELRSKLTPGAVALVFYAGHGLQIKGDNYLPAVDADINTEEDVPNQSLAMKQIMDVLDESKTRLNLVFLDACRNNPYARSFRSADKGLARVSAPSGTLISYATKPGSVAADGDGRNGLYTSKLLAQMDSSLQIELTLKRIVTEVKAASKGKQEPWMEGSIEGDFCFAGCAQQ